MKKQINVCITPEGKIVVEGAGFKGSGCEKAIKKLLDGLGKAEGKKKHEYYLQDTSNQTKIKLNQ